MKTDRGLTVAALHDALDYNPDTGVFTSRTTGRQVGCKAGKYGRIQIHLGGVGRYANRLAWFYVHGVWPDGQVDHINGDHTDNRITNLRVLSNQDNKQNTRRPYSTNRTGILGVSYDERSQMYRARITTDGHTVNLGTYADKLDAQHAYLTAKERMHPAWVA